MKSLGRAFVMIISSVVLFVHCEKEINPYDPVDIPDQNFLDALIEKGVDTNGDGIISHEEAASVTFLRLLDGDKIISNLEGIEKFYNVDTLLLSNVDVNHLSLDHNTKLKFIWMWSNEFQYLDVSNCNELNRISCYYNKLTHLDLPSYGRNLEKLDCDGNQLTRLNVSHFINLEQLNCSNNKLSTLNVSNNVALTALSCSDNHLGTLEISNNPELRYLSCNSCGLGFLDFSNQLKLESLECCDNHLSELDVSNQIILEYLDCCDNRLSELDVSNNIELLRLNCSGNEISSMDIANNMKLEWVECSGHYLIENLNISNHFELERIDFSYCGLTSLDISNNVKLQYIILHNMYSLGKVCIWEGQFPLPGCLVDIRYSENAYFTADCSK